MKDEEVKVVIHAVAQKPVVNKVFNFQRRHLANHWEVRQFEARKTTCK